MKAEVLDAVLGLECHTFSIGPLVEGECGSDSPIMAAALASGALHRIDDEAISATAFTELLVFYELGDGETECLALADSNPVLVICSDDGAARAAATARFGAERVIGCLFLLRDCVRNQILTVEQAQLTYQLMRLRGGFLPDLSNDYFAN